MEYFYLIYPEKRTVSADWIWRQYQDACENCEIADEFLDLKPPMYHEMAMAMSDAGLITVGRRKNE